ncbi:MAG TPA: hemerythrin domain-containing protein [Ktedonobacterales bacterium]|jgi:iron-sulfur cluster repair protein YtfE (RIC family)
MTIPTQPLRDEHQELRPHVERLREAGEAVGDTPTPELRALLDEVNEFLGRHLIPHAQAEEAALYPVVARLMGAPEATATMRRDHVEIGRLVEELRTLQDQLADSAYKPGEAESLRRTLYGLYAVIALHFAKEEGVYLPLLDARLSSDEAREMFQRMEEAAAEAKQNAANAR